MLEVCPSHRRRHGPTLEIHPLGIGGREDPVRLVFDADPGPRRRRRHRPTCGDRFRLVANEVDGRRRRRSRCRSCPSPAPSGARSPTSRTSAEAWLTAGGPHHTVLSTALTAPSTCDDFAEIARHRARAHRRRHHDRAASARSCAGTRPTTAWRRALLDHADSSTTDMRQHEPTRGTQTDRRPPASTTRMENHHDAQDRLRWPPSRHWPSRAARRADDATTGASGRHRRRQRRAPIGVAMPTKTSERWIEDGDDVKAAARGRRLQGRPAVRRGRHPDPGHPDREHDHQGRQGPDRRLDRRHRPRPACCSDAKDADIPVIAYDRLIRDTENVDYYATFDNFKVGEQQAKSLARRASRPRGKRRPVQRRAVRRFARRQQRDLLLQRRDGGPAAAHRRRHLSRQSRPDRLRAGRHPALGRRPPPRSAWRTCSPRPTPTERGQRRALPYDGLSRGIIAALKGTGYGSGGKTLPDRHRPGRRARVGQVDPRRRAVLHDLQGHPRARQGHRRR